MEYAIEIDDSYTLNDGFVKHVGYQENNRNIQQYYSHETIQIISHKVTELLMGVDPQNRPIIVPNKTISSVMDSVYSTYRPPTGDIYGRYNVPSGESTTSYIQNMIDQVIEIIVSDVRNNLETEENNSKLSIWSTLYGDFNNQGLQQHSKIKVRNKRPTPMQFMMNY
jgi:hypothetical protein